MRYPESQRSFSAIMEEIEIVVIELKHASKRRERMALLRELRILLKEMDIEVGYLTVPANLNASNACLRN